MSKIDELQKRVEHLETEVELLKELVKLQNKCPERSIPTYPSSPLQPYYTKEPTLKPPYKFTCGNGVPEEEGEDDYMPTNAEINDLTDIGY